MDDVKTVSFEEFQRITGRRFRLRPDETARIKAGEATRDDILLERFDDLGMFLGEVEFFGGVG